MLLKLSLTPPTFMSFQWGLDIIQLLWLMQIVIQNQSLFCYQINFSIGQGHLMAILLDETVKFPQCRVSTRCHILAMQ